MATDDGHDAERLHKRVEVVQRTIAHTPSEGLLGIAIKLALTSYLEGFADGSDGDVSRSAYLDTLRIFDRDSSPKRKPC